MWQMPMDDEYREFIKGQFRGHSEHRKRQRRRLDYRRDGLSEEFAGDTPWIHLDIAGTAWNDDAKPWLAKGPTGVALRTLVQLVTSL